jgi:hypothetical protein
MPSLRHSDSLRSDNASSAQAMNTNSKLKETTNG